MPRDQQDASAVRVTVRVLDLGEEPLDDPDDLMERTTAEERIEILRQLTERAWRLSGRPWPSYSRGQIPIRVTRIE